MSPWIFAISKGTHVCLNIAVDCTVLCLFVKPYIGNQKLVVLLLAIAFFFMHGLRQVVCVFMDFVSF